MPKIPHRIFEIYESREEAIHAMTPKVEKAAMDSSALGSWKFEHLIVSRSAGVTHVQFTEAKEFEEATVSGLCRDFAQLANSLGIDSKVLVDFTGVELFSRPFIDALVSFSRQLRTKGSRIALCCLAPAARAFFFVPDERGGSSSTRKD
jgi:anti-anti-sigma regulatory factor